MRAKRLITRAILATVTAGSIATGVVVPLASTAAPAAPVAAQPSLIYYGG